MTLRSARIQAIAGTLALAASYVVAARLGLMLDAVSGFATLVWAPTGIALACLLRGGDRLWPGVAIGAFIANAWVGAPWPAAVGIALGNTAEALLGAWLIRRFARFQRLDGLRAALGVVLLGAGASTIVSATVGVASLWVAGIARHGQLIATWRAWWLGDAAGDLLVAPLLLAWNTRAPWRRPSITPLRIGEAVALGATLSALAFAVFFGLFPEVGFSHSYLVFPPLIWASLRFHERGSTLATLLVSGVGIWATVAGHGPFVAPRLATSLLHLQAFMSIVAITTLLLASAVSERERAVASRQAMLAIVSHDLKNPLTTIRLSTSTVESLTPDDAPARKHLERVALAADRMELLLRNLLDLAAIEAGRMEMHRERFDAASVLREAADLMRPIATARRQTIECEAGAVASHALADRERVLQVLSNLLGNAVKFAPEASAIVVRVEAADDRVCFSVIDRGPGLSRDQLARVFERFWQAKPSGGGLGLGLSIAREIVEANGGRIWAESSQGAGATFSFTLPAASETPDPAPVPATA